MRWPGLVLFSRPRSNLVECRSCNTRMLRIGRIVAVVLSGGASFGTGVGEPRGVAFSLFHVLAFVVGVWYWLVRSLPWGVLYPCLGVAATVCARSGEALPSA